MDKIISYQNSEKSIINLLLYDDYSDEILENIKYLITQKNGIIILDLEFNIENVNIIYQKFFYDIVDFIGQYYNDSLNKYANPKKIIKSLKNIISFYNLRLDYQLVSIDNRIIQIGQVV